MRHRRTKHGGEYARVLISLGTLAHNRAFTAQDVRSYLHYGSLGGHGGGVSAPRVDAALKYFKRRGWLRAGDGRGELYPTPTGWRAIEKAAHLHMRGRR